jgi:hypothetical protein
MQNRTWVGFLLGASLVAPALVAAGCSDGGSAPPAGATGQDAAAAEADVDAADGSTQPGDGASGNMDTGASDATSNPVDGGNHPTDSGSHTDSGSDGSSTDGGDAATGPVLVTTVAPGTTPVAVKINQGTAIGEGKANGATPFVLTNLAVDSNNTETIQSATDPFARSGNVPDTAYGFCDYSGATPTRVSYATGAKFEVDAGSDTMVPMAPFYFPLTYTTTLTPSGNAFGGKAPIIGLFDWRPKDIDEALVVAESDDDGQTWYFMQTVLELFPDYTNPISGGYDSTSTNTGCPPTLQGTNASTTAVNGSTADDGWGHAAIIQLPGPNNAATGQFLYMLDRAPNAVDVSPLHVINLAHASNKFPIWNTNNTAAGANDIKSISSALDNTADAGAPVVVQNTSGLLDPDGIMAVFPTASGAAAGSPVTVLYVQKILNGDDTGSTAMPTSEQCTAAPFSGKTNHDISNVRLATTTDGINFTDLGVVSGLNDPTTVDYNGTRWISPRATLLDVHGDGSLWGLYFAGGNCLDGDSDAFHYIGYAESTDKMHWTVYYDVNHPIASINTITTANQSDGKMVTIPAQAPVVPTQYWFAERLYAPTATRIDPTHLSLTFAGYGVQTPNKDLLDYRQIGNVELTVSQALPGGVPNNINAH